MSDFQSAAKQSGDTRAAAWLVLAVLLLFSVAAPLNQYKVPPIMPILIVELGLSVSSAGLLMSVFAVTGLILALPASLVYQKAGARVTGLLVGGSILLGATLGALSHSLGALLASRAIEGIGTTFMAVLAPAVIAQWFTARQRGTAMGIWATWVPVGSVSMLLLAPRLAQASSWRAVWWLGAVYALAVTLLYLAFVRPNPASTAAPAGPAPAPAVTSTQVLRNRTIWLLAAAFATFSWMMTGLNTYLPTFLATQRGVPLASAGLLSSIVVSITILSAPVGGVLSDKIGSRKKPYLVAFAAAMLLVPFVGILNLAGVIVLLVLLGLAVGVIPTNLFAAAIEAAGDRRQGGTAMAVIMVGQMAGVLLGPLVVGTLAQTVGWPAAFASLAVMPALGLLAGWLAKVR